MDFPDIVKYVREKTGMSQEELANALKTSFSTISRWENGKTHPNKMAKFVFFSFCEQHGINAEEMLVTKRREE
jgi:DNA-binding transcriptional regulator YiaG